MRIRFDQEKCTGCYACYVACIAAHHQPEDTEAHSWRRVVSVCEEESGFQKKICTGCTHCGACITVCPGKAIYREETFGTIQIDPERCTGCGACGNICPVDAVFFGADGKAGKCDGCIGRLQEGREPACVRACCIGTIRMEK